MLGKLILIYGNIVSEEILLGQDAIVNPTNPRMVAGAGVSGEIFKKAGVDKLERYTQSKYNIGYYTNDNLMQVGDIRVTPGFDLGMDIIFVQGPKSYDYDNSIIPLLETYTNLLNEIERQKYEYIVMPSLGTGTYGYNHNVIAKEVMYLIREFIKDKPINIKYILYDEQTMEIYRQYVQ